MPAPPLQTIRILGIDPGTHHCGVALIQYPINGQPTVITAFLIRGGSGDYVRRVRQITAELADFTLKRGLFGPGCLVGIEVPYSKTGSNSEGKSGLEMVWALIGGIISRIRLENVELIQPNSVAAIFGASRMNRDDKKAAAIDWARTQYGLQLGDQDHDVAEALAVALASGAAWKRRQQLRIREIQQPRLELKVKVKPAPKKPYKKVSKTTDQ